MKVASLCAGYGGLEMGMQLAGITALCHLKRLRR